MGYVYNEHGIIGPPVNVTHVTHVSAKGCIVSLGRCTPPLIGYPYHRVAVQLLAWFNGVHYSTNPSTY